MMGNVAVILVLHRWVIRLGKKRFKTQAIPNVDGLGAYAVNCFSEMNEHPIR